MASSLRSFASTAEAAPSHEFFSHLFSRMGLHDVVTAMTPTAGGIDVLGSFKALFRSELAPYGRMATIISLIFERNVPKTKSYLSTHPDKARKEINSIFSGRRLNPLQIALMLDAHEIATVIAESGLWYDIDSRDSSGNNTLHLLAMTVHTAALRELIISKGVDRSAVNLRRGTPDDLFRLTEAIPDARPPTFFFKPTPEASVEERSAEDFSRLTRARLLTRTVTTPAALFMDWLSTAPSDLPDPKAPLPEVYRTLLESIERYHASSPRVYLQPHPVTGLSVYALGDIPVGEVVCQFEAVYCADVNVEHATRQADKVAAGGGAATPTQYSNPSGYAEEERGLGPMIDDGLPNCKMFNLPNLTGLPLTTYLIAITHIKAGDHVMYDYANDFSLKYQKSYPLRREELERLASEFAASGKTLTTCLMDPAFGVDEDIKKLFPESLFLFLLRTPASLLYLASSYPPKIKKGANKTSIHEMHDLISKTLSHRDLPDLVVPKNPDFAKKPAQLLKLLGNWCAAFDKLSSDEQARFLPVLLNNLKAASLGRNYETITRVLVMQAIAMSKGEIPSLEPIAPSLAVERAAGGSGASAGAGSA